MVDNLEAKTIIDSIEMEKTIQYLQVAEGWTHDEAADGCEQYKNYLFLLISYPEELLPPSFQIQRTWKAHVLSSLDDYLELKKILTPDNSNILNFKNYFEDK